MTSARIGRWGKTLAVRIPAAVARAAKFDTGAMVEVTALDDNSVIVRRLAADPTLEVLFADQPPGLWREAYRDAFDWGRDRGRETVEE